MNCPVCGAKCDRVEVDIGVGIQCGPWQCSACDWTEDERLEFDDDELDEFWDEL